MKITWPFKWVLKNAYMPTCCWICFDGLKGLKIIVFCPLPTTYKKLPVTSKWSHRPINDLIMVMEMFFHFANPGDINIITETCRKTSMFLGYDISSIELLIVSETVFETLKTLSKHQRVIAEESKACVSPREHLLHLRIQMFRVQVNPPGPACSSGCQVWTTTSWNRPCAYENK